MLDLATASEYRLAHQRDLAWDLAAIHRPTDALTFVRRYGLLHHGPDDEHDREPFAEFEQTAFALRWTMRTYSLLRDASSFLQGASDADAGKLDELRKWMGRIVSEKPPPTGLAELLGYASEMVAGVVSDGLKGVTERLEPLDWLGGEGPPDLFVLTAQPRDLVGYAWHQLAAALDKHVPMGACEDCGRHFEIVDKRMRFCSRACSQRARYRRWSDKRRAAVGESA